MKQNTTVYGASLHIGNFKNDDGKTINYDYMKMNVLTDQNPGQDPSLDRVGFVQTELRGDSSIFPKFRNQTYPVDCDLEMVLDVKAKATTVRVIAADFPASVDLKKTA